MPSSDQALALAEPEARLYNHQPPRPTRSKCLFRLYLSHFSTDWAEILHDCYLGGKDEVCRQNIDPAALQYSMQRCRISNQTITQPFLIRLSLNLAWLLRRCKQSSLDTKQWPCGTAVFHTVHAEFLSAKHSAISQWIKLKLHYIAVSQPFKVNFFLWHFSWRGYNFFKSSFFWGPWGKLKFIFWARIKP